MGAKVPSVDHRRHAHRHDEARRAAGEQSPRETVFTVFEGDPRAHHLLDEGLEKSRHRAVPQREYDGDVLRRNDRVSGLDQTFGHLTGLKVFLCAQDRKIELRHFNPCHLMSRRDGTFRVGIGKCVAESVSGGIGMSLDDRYLVRHGAVSVIATAPLYSPTRSAT